MPKNNIGLFLLLLLPFNLFASHYVGGSFRSNGTYVAAHFMSVDEMCGHRRNHVYSPGFLNLQKKGYFLFAMNDGSLVEIKSAIKKIAIVNKVDRHHTTSLYKAVKKSNIGYVQRIINGNNVNFFVEGKNFKETPLLRAVLDNNEDMAQLLIKNGADPNLNDGVTPLIGAVLNGNIKIIDELISAKANINSTDFAKYKDGRDSTVWWGGYTPLMIAVVNGNIDMVKELVKKGADVNFFSSQGVTALHYAVRLQQTDIADFLIKNGADIDVFMEYPYFVYVSDISGSGPGLATGKFEASLLMDLVAFSKIASGPDVNDDFTLLEGHDINDMVTFLINNDVNVNAKDQDGWDALKLSVSLGEYDLTKLLLENGANPNQLFYDGTTSLMGAATDRMDLVRLLINSRADINIRDNLGNSALIFSIYHNKTDIARYLIEKNADINYRNKDGGSPFVIAARAGNFDVVKLLIKRGADINEKGEGGVTALMVAIINNNNNLARLLISNNPDVNETTDLGVTALMCAAKGGSIDMVKLLMNSGADMSEEPDIKTGDNALSVAKRNNKWEIANYLREHSYKNKNS